MQTGEENFDEIDDLYDDVIDNEENPAGESNEGEESPEGDAPEGEEPAGEETPEGDEANADGEEKPAEEEPAGEYDFGDEGTTEGEETPEGEEGEDNPEGKDEGGDVEVTGMELWLSKYGIDAGMIPFEDGEEIHFNELAADKQEEIIDTLIQSKITSMEDKFNLSEDEIAFLNVGRNENKTVQEVIDRLASERVEAIIAQRESGNANYKDMSDDGIYMKYLQANAAEGETPEQIQEKLEEAKKSQTYEQLVGLIRKDYMANQEAAMTLQQRQEKEQEAKVLETEREEIVDAAMGINSVLGQVVDNEKRNEVLADLLEINEYGDSLFMEKVFSDPEKLFKVAWISKYGEDSISSKDDYWKKEVTKAYKRGYNKAADGLPSTSVSATKKPSKKKPAAPQELNNDIDSLYP